MNKTIISVILSLFLISCTTAQKGYLGFVVESVKDTNDTIAQGLISSMCGISVGAYYRLQNTVHKNGIRKLCGGSNSVELDEKD